MNFTKLNDIREKYLTFFEGKGHLRLESSSLIPSGDKSLLLINSGMAPLKKYFTGEVTPPSKRVTTSQKCVRMIDIENVGKTSRHATFFEMLGNFSFNDYFKHDATSWAWEFCIKVLEIPIDKLWISVYEDDDETIDIWVNHVGIDKNRIVRLGKADNYWEHGIGPCGPCSEIYYDRGAASGCDSDNCAVGCDCDRYVEFWNLVFTQFYNDGTGNYSPLKNKNIDTGMGLERLACIMQNVDNIFEIDTMQSIINHISKLAKISYKANATTDMSLKIIADHIRSAVFMVSDGISPSNEGRGYVLRRLIRRAARHGKLLGINGLFLKDLAGTVIESYMSAYPQLDEKRNFIFKLISTEEENFAKTIDQGLAKLNDLIDNHINKPITGADAFVLYDTYGFPFDLTKDILLEKNIEIDEQEFTCKMKEQVERARAARKGNSAEAWAEGENLLAGIPPTNFIGYNNLKAECKVLAIIQDGELLQKLDNANSATIALDISPFYAESGGQCGDKGIINSNGMQFTVDDAIKNNSGIYMHLGSLNQGSISVSENITAMVDYEFRDSVKRNHTAAHLLQYAARQVLGNHVEQAGQSVNDATLRFDFNHFSAITLEELREIENLVNNIIFDAITVKIETIPIAQAKEMGATALFSEKYGDTVRVVDIGGRSIELCGGTHVSNTANIGLFKILSESSVASGVRRIEAITGRNVLHRMDIYEDILNDVKSNLNISNLNDISDKSMLISQNIRKKEKEIESLYDQISDIKFSGVLDNWQEISRINFVTAKIDNVTTDSLKKLCDKVRAEKPNFVAAFASTTDDGGIIFCCAVGKTAVNMGMHAGNIVKHIASIIGGTGGGRPDFAMGGGNDSSKINDALISVEQYIKDNIK